MRWVCVMMCAYSQDAIKAPGNRSRKSWCASMSFSSIANTTTRNISKMDVKNDLFLDPINCIDTTPNHSFFRECEGIITGQEENCIVEGCVKWFDENKWCWFQRHRFESWRRFINNDILTKFWTPVTPFKRLDSERRLSCCLPNTSTFVPNDCSQCLYCVLPIMLCAFVAHLDVQVGLVERQTPCRFVGNLTFPSLFLGEDGHLW